MNTVTNILQQGMRDLSVVIDLLMQGVGDLTRLIKNGVLLDYLKDNPTATIGLAFAAMTLWIWATSTTLRSR